MRWGFPKPEDDKHSLFAFISSIEVAFGQGRHGLRYYSLGRSPAKGGLKSIPNQSVNGEGRSGFLFDSVSLTEWSFPLKKKPQANALGGLLISEGADLVLKPSLYRLSVIQVLQIYLFGFKLLGTYFSTRSNQMVRFVCSRLRVPLEGKQRWLNLFAKLPKRFFTSSDIFLDHLKMWNCEYNRLKLAQGDTKMPSASSEPN